MPALLCLQNKPPCVNSHNNAQTKQHHVTYHRMTSDAEISTMAYFAAAKQGNAPQLESMLGSGEIANANIQDELGNTALHYACAADHYEAVQLLCQKGANVNTANNFGDTRTQKNNNYILIYFSHYEGHMERFSRCN